MKHKSGTNCRCSKSRSRIWIILAPWVPEGIFCSCVWLVFYGSFKMSFHTDFTVYNGMECSLSALRGDLWEICEAKLNESDFGWKRTKIPTFWCKICLDQAYILKVRGICSRKFFLIILEWELECEMHETRSSGYIKRKLPLCQSCIIYQQALYYS